MTGVYPVCLRGREERVYDHACHVYFNLYTADAEPFRRLSNEEFRTVEWELVGETPTRRKQTREETGVIGVREFEKLLGKLSEQEIREMTGGG